MDINVTLLGQAITFGVFIWVTMKYIWPPILGAMEEREAKIAKGLAAAEEGNEQMELAERHYEKRLQEAKMKSAEILEQANKRALEMVEEAKQDARDEAAKIKLSAESELASSLSQAREQLRADVANIAVLGAEKILQREIDTKTHQQLLDELKQEL